MVETSVCRANSSHLDHGDANDKFNHGAEDGQYESSANDGTNRYVTIRMSLSSLEIVFWNH
jgi:hypothetical protein